MERPRDALPEGTKLAGYVLGRVLGRGGFGITYFGHDALFPATKVAIKEFLPSGLAVREAGSSSVHPSGSGSEADFRKALDRFEEEARTLVALRHPNVVEVQRYIEANGTAYVVMKYEDGRSLAEILAGGRTLAVSDLDGAIAPLLDGLSAVHARNYLHRDIKPGNIYIRAGDGSPVLLDFGAARQAMGAERLTTLTEIVTPGYAPFEQYFRKGEQGPWTDIYALGATFYRCIAGEAPPEAPERIRRDGMIPAQKIGSGRYPQTLLAAIDSMLAIDEKNRPQSIDELRNTLKLPSRNELVSRDAAQTLVVDQLPIRDSERRFSDSLLQAAKMGDALAQVGVGECYQAGTEVRQSFDKAFDWYLKAAEQGNASGQYRLGVLYWRGLGVPQDEAKAVAWWRFAAEQGNRNAQRSLGDAYGLGRGVPWDYVEAAKWYRLAADQGDVTAQLNLTYIYSSAAFRDRS